MTFDGSIVFFGTENLDNCYDFYVNTLGLTLYKDQGLCHIYDTGEGKLGFCNHIEVINKEKSPIITLLTDNVDKVYNKIIKKGFIVDKKPNLNKQFRIYHFFIKDPNGYTVEIQKFLD
ncbi:MAG: VOC family protein [Firmicutes bacterium]|nr:VOC family protein [Bacillota bacterium]